MKRKNALRIKKTWQSITAGIVTGIIITVLIIMLLAGFLVKYDIPLNSVKFLLFIPAIISGFFAGAVTGKYVRSKGFLWGFVSSVSVAVVLLITLLLINSFSVNPIIILLIPVYAISGSIGGIITSNMK